MRLIVTTFIALLIFAIGITAARAVGSSQSLATDSFVGLLIREVRLTDGQWCWRDICLQRTLIADVPQIAANYAGGDLEINEQDFRWTSTMSSPSLDVMIHAKLDQDNVTGLYIGKGYVTVGELLLFLGSPRSIERYPVTSSPKQVRFIFTGNVPGNVFASTSVESSDLRLNTRLYVSRIYFRP
ncbi:MAG: hypothetical protein KF726_09545 [Anaerolineae bacterium]|nr:hypothetical protein [Anaerolineae bacterium]